MISPMTGGSISTPEPPPKDLRLRFWWLRITRQLLCIGLALCLIGLLVAAWCFLVLVHLMKPLPEAPEPDTSVQSVTSFMVGGLFSIACGIRAIVTSRRFREAAYVESHEPDPYMAALQSLWVLLCLPSFAAILVLFAFIFFIVILLRGAA